VRWHRRPRVRKCEFQCPCECHSCGIGGIHCEHEENEDGECCERDCPLYKNGRWIKCASA
jgi:hypothetical protein